MEDGNIWRAVNYSGFQDLAYSFIMVKARQFPFFVVKPGGKEGKEYCSECFQGQVLGLILVLLFFLTFSCFLSEDVAVIFQLPP